MLAAVLILDAKAGGAPAAASAVTSRFKMRPDEALKILNIEKGDLTKQLLDQVRQGDDSCISLFFYELLLILDIILFVCVCMRSFL